jgi:hypothetical protein
MFVFTLNLILFVGLSVMMYSYFTLKTTLTLILWGKQKSLAEIKQQGFFNPPLEDGSYLLSQRDASSARGGQGGLIRQRRIGIGRIKIYLNR